MPFYQKTVELLFISKFLDVYLTAFIWLVCLHDCSVLNFLMVVLTKLFSLITVLTYSFSYL